MWIFNDRPMRVKREPSRMERREANTKDLEKVLKKGKEYRIHTSKSAMVKGVYTGTETIGRLKLYLFDEDGFIRKFTNPDLAFGKVFGAGDVLLFDGVK